MIRLLFDTSIYSLLIKEKDYIEIKDKIISDKEIKIVGFSVIRKELRNIPKGMIHQDKKLRPLLLSLYDELTENKTIQKSERIKKLAEKYFMIYKKYKGGFKWSEMENDFKIVACASIHGVDILSSYDSKTMLNKTSIKAYREANDSERLRNPEFISYEELKIRFF